MTNKERAERAQKAEANRAAEARRIAAAVAEVKTEIEAINFLPTGDDNPFEVTCARRKERWLISSYTLVSYKSFKYQYMIWNSRCRPARLVILPDLPKAAWEQILRDFDLGF